jgi:hypothetical protein
MLGRVDATDLSQALDLGSKALAIIVSAVGLVVAVSQWTRPAILARREKWLREALEAETHAARRSTLSEMLTSTTAQIVGGIKVPGWRFIVLAVLMLLGPAQAFGLARGDTSVGGVIVAIFLSLAITANPTRLAIRLLAERYRVADEYRRGAEINPPRFGMLNLTEGGTRKEFVFAWLIAVAVNALSASVAVFVLGQPLWGLGLGLASAVALILLMRAVNRYALSRVETYGPWSVADPQM